MHDVLQALCIHVGPKLVSSIEEKNPNFRRVSIFMMHLLNSIDIAKSEAKIDI